MHDYPGVALFKAATAAAAAAAEQVGLQNRWSVNGWDVMLLRSLAFAFNYQFRIFMGFAI